MRSRLFCAIAVGAFCLGNAAAKLPPLSEEAKAKAAEATAKAAWTDKVGLYKLCQAQDRIVQAYRTSAKGAGRDAPNAAVAVAACADPGPFVAPESPAEKPLEASGAHSPAGTATSPPSNKATSAEMTGPRK